MGLLMKKLLKSLARCIARAAGLFVYDYPKADCTATVVVLFDNGTRTLVILRKHAPYKGQRAFPGGFLDIGDETVEHAALRELIEEVTLRFGQRQFMLVDVRSEPNRDPRGHVVDHGYLVVVPPEETASTIAQIKAADDADGYEVLPVAELLATGMAFDHIDLLREALVKAGYSRAH